MLKSLASIIDLKRNAINAQPLDKCASKGIEFVREGQKPPNRTPNARVEQLEGGRDWELRVNLDHQLTIPRELAISNLGPDMVMWSNKLWKVYLIELSIRWESCIQEAHEGKRIKYTDVASEIGNRGWDTKIYPVEVGCWGFMATSNILLLRYLGITGRALCQATKEPSNETEFSSRWLWIKRNEKI